MADDVEGLSPYRFLWSFDGRNIRPSRVADVHQWTPHLPPVVYRNPAPRQSILHECVDHEIIPHAWRPAVDGSLSEDYGAEVRTGHGYEPALSLVLGTGVGSAGSYRCILIKNDVLMVVALGGRGEAFW